MLEVGRDEAGWHSVSFRKARKSSLCLLTVIKSSRHLFFLADLKPSRFFFSRCGTTPGIIIVLHEFKREYSTHGNNKRAKFYAFGLIIKTAVSIADVFFISTL
jgi:hypothetical protein